MASCSMFSCSMQALLFWSVVPVMTRMGLAALLLLMGIVVTSAVTVSERCTNIPADCTPPPPPPGSPPGTQAPACAEMPDWQRPPPTNSRKLQQVREQERPLVLSCSFGTTAGRRPTQQDTVPFCSRSVLLSFRKSLSKSKRLVLCRCV